MLPDEPQWEIEACSWRLDQGQTGRVRCDEMHLLTQKLKDDILIITADLWPRWVSC